MLKHILCIISSLQLASHAEEIEKFVLYDETYQLPPKTVIESNSELNFLKMDFLAQMGGRQIKGAFKNIVSTESRLEVLSKVEMHYERITKNDTSLTMNGVEQAMPPDHYPLSGKKLLFSCSESSDQWSVRCADEKLAAELQKRAESILLSTLYGGSVYGVQPRGIGEVWSVNQRGLDIIRAGNPEIEECEAVLTLLDVYTKNDTQYAKLKREVVMKGRKMMAGMAAETTMKFDRIEILDLDHYVLTSSTGTVDSVIEGSNDQRSLTVSGSGTVKVSKEISFTP